MAAKQQATDTTIERFTHSTRIDGKAVQLRHVFRRRYVVAIKGKDVGYITARDANYAINRIEACTLKNLKLHKQ